MNRKFKIGGWARFIPSGDVYQIDHVSEDGEYCHLKGWLTDLYVDDLSPCEAPDHDGHSSQGPESADHIADAGNMLRLQIAAQIMPGIMIGVGEHFTYCKPGSRWPSLINRQFPEEVARVAFIFADALIAESQKGGDK